MTIDQRATLAKRVWAFLYDYLIMLAYMLILFVLSITVSTLLGLDSLQPRSSGYSFAFDLFAFVILILPVILYFTVYESSDQRGSWGKQKVGLQVVNRGGQKLTWMQALGRSLLKFLPWQVAHTSLFLIDGWPFAPAEPPLISIIGFTLVYGLIGLYFLWAVFSKTNQALYDWAIGSYVVVR